MANMSVVKEKKKGKKKLEEITRKEELLEIWEEICSH